MKRSALLLSLCCIGLMLSATTLWQNPVPIRQGDNVNWNRTGAATADGCMIYVWSGTKRGDRDIYAQKVNAAGTLLWQQPLLVDAKPSRQANPVISRTTDNNFIIAWVDFPSEEEVNLRAQKITSNGQLLWSVGGIPVCSGPQYLSNVEILADNNSGAYIVWCDNRNPTYDIYGQHLDGYGNSLWITGGLPLANSAVDEQFFSMVVDTSGMLNISYQEVNMGASQIKANRFLSSGLSAWAQPLLVSGQLINNNHVQMTALQDSTFVVTWSAGQSPTEYGPDIYAQRYDLNGILDWANPVCVYSDSNTPYPTPQVKPRIVNSVDNAVVIAWEDNRNDWENPDIYIQKVSADGTLLWNVDSVPVCTANYGQRNQRLVADNTGGIYITWEDARNGNYPYVDIYAQHISANGIALWETQGSAVCTANYTQSEPMVRCINNNIFIGWLDARDGSPSLYYQVLNSQGNPILAANGKLIHQGLGGDAGYWDYLTLPRTSDVAVIWQDTRNGPLGYKIFFQFLNPDGTVDLEPNGRPITSSLNTGIDQIYFSAVTTPDNKISIVWEEDHRVKAQLIDAGGNRLWGDDGIFLTDIIPLQQKDAKISYENGAFYIGWSQIEGVNTPQGLRQVFRVFGQKIVNNQKQWGADGVLISESLPDDVSFEANLSQVTGRYYVMERYSIDPDSFSNRNIYVKLVNPDGTTAAGWPGTGIVTSDYWFWDTMQYLPQTVMTNSGLVVTWLDFRTDFITSIYGQLISPQGVRLWNSSGIPLTASSFEDKDVSLLGSGDSFTLFWSEFSVNYTGVVRVQKYNLNGEPLWSQGGNPVSINAPYHNCSMAFPAVFPNGGIVAAWEHYYLDAILINYYDPDIFYRYINPDGSMIGNLSGTLLTDEFDEQLRPRLTVVGNEAILTWGDADFVINPDGRCGPEYDTFNLYAQKLSNEVVAIEDEVIIPSQVVLHQNYPNPFTALTNISFSLPAKSDVRIDIYNIKGQKVKTLLNSMQEKGNGAASWDGLDLNGKSCSSGIYYCKLTVNGRSQTRKMLLVK